MLRLKDVTKNYQVGENQIKVLKGLNVSFRKNEFVSILGPSGCGKTTTLNIVGGLDQYTSGDLFIGGKSTKHFSDRDWDTYRNNRIGFVFQSYNLIPHQTVLGNVELALTISGIAKEERVKRALTALEKVGLKGEEYKRPNQLSGGQCQRVAIARALVNQPDILLLDEPTGALDSKTSVQIMELIKEVSKDKLVIMVTHNAEIARDYSTRIVRLVDGEIVEDTNPYSEEEEIKEYQQVTTNLKTKKKKKSKMSLWTAFRLSLRNLFTKKGRTLLTSFAGSIGIIGIALILAVSQGTTAYINHVQETTLSSYPITLESTAIDLTTLIESFMGVGEKDSEHGSDAIYKDPVIYELVNALSKVETSENDLKSFKAYLEGEMNKKDSALSKAVSGVQYSYDLQFDIYTENTDGEIIKSDTQELMSDMITKYIMGVSTGSIQTKPDSSSNPTMFSTMMMSNGMWQELLPETDGGVVNGLIKEQYDLIYGDWPTQYNEVVLVVNDKNEIDDLTLYALGLIGEDKIDAIINAAINGQELPPEEVSWSYEQVCQREYKMFLPFDNYSYSDLTQIWFDNTSFMDLSALYDKAMPLDVTGIIRQNPKAENHMLTGSICYTYKLTEHVINQAEDADVVKAQLENENIDVFTGKPFKSSTGNLTPSEKKTAFINYVSNLTDRVKAKTYISIKSILDDTVLTSSAQNMLSTEYNTTEAQIGLIAEVYSAQMPNLDVNQIKLALGDLSPEYVESAALVVCKGIVQMRNATMVEQQIRGLYPDDTEDTQIAELLEQDIQNDVYTQDEYALYYDNLTEFSSSTFESNLKKLGYMDLNSPDKINIYASSFENKDVIVAAIDDYNQSVEETKAIKYTDFMGLMMSSITTIIDAITYVLIAFVSISLIVSSIMIGVITLISVQERTKEIGILRSIGASKRDVSHLFNAETLIIGLSSGLFGVLVTYLLCIPINLILQALTGIATLKATLPIVAAVILTLISMLLTLVSGIIPSRSAAKKDPVVALRTE